jgi:hypothetical protein
VLAFLSEKCAGVNVVDLKLRESICWIESTTLNGFAMCYKRRYIERTDNRLRTPSDEAVMQVTLQVTEGPHKGQTFTLQGHETFLVGRSRQAHLRLPAKDRYFSRVHFLVELNPPQCRLMDMDSRNGTHVNGARVEMADLKDGDQIRAGHTIFRVCIAAAPPEPEAALPEPEPATTAPKPTVPVSSLPTLATQGSRALPAQLPPASGVSLVTQSEGPARDDSIPPSLAPTPDPRTQPALPPVPPRPARPSQRVPVVPATPATEPARREVVATVPACCVCGGARVGAPAGSAVGRHPIEQRLCGDCLRRMNSLEQTVPGYRLLRELGRGGMGIVYLAARDGDGNLVALKMIIPAVEVSQTELQKFLREAEILKQLDHPHIVRFRDMNTSGGRLWFAMDYVAGIDAGRLLRKHGPLAVPRAVTLVCQLLEALEYAHARGFIHRDIKPANLLLSQRGGRESAVLADFGLARVYQASQLSGLTVTGAIGGTPMFMPPEQITHYRQAQPAADQYAAAMTLYNLLTGRYGFDAPDQFKQWIAMILEEEPVPIRQRREEVPQGLAEVIHRALKKEPRERFADVRALRQALQPFAHS